MATRLDRSVVESFLRGLRYPISRDELLHLAQLSRMPDWLMDALRELPPGEFGSAQEVTDHLQALGYDVT